MYLTYYSVMKKYSEIYSLYVTCTDTLLHKKGITFFVIRKLFLHITLINILFLENSILFLLYFVNSNKFLSIIPKSSLFNLYKYVVKYKKII